jgi:glycosyl transferase, family 25
MSDPRTDSNDVAVVPIFVLTLRGDEARRAPLLKQLESMGLEYELFFGIDGRNGLPPECEDRVDRARARRKYRRALSDGELACAISHIEVCREIARRKLAHAIVLEDDAILDDAFVEFVRGIPPVPGDILLLDHSHARVERGRGIPVLPEVEARRLVVRPSLATAYFLTNAGAWEISRAALPVSDVADWPECVDRMAMWALDPRIVDHPNPVTGPSHLRNDRRPVRSDPLRFFRRAFWRVWIRKRLAVRIS